MPVPLYLRGWLIPLTAGHLPPPTPPLKVRDLRPELAKPGTRLNEVGLSADLLAKRTISFLDGHKLEFHGLGIDFLDKGGLFE